MANGRFHVRFDGSWTQDGHAMQIRETAVTSESLARGAVSCLASYALTYEGIASLRGSWTGPDCHASGAVTFRRE
jgi:hypothetical protein